MKILVTGGAGYIGSHTVVELINAGHEPVIVDNFCNSHVEVIARLQAITGKDLVYHEGDCCDPEFMWRVFDAEENICGVIHFAALKSVEESIKKPDLYRHNNLRSLDVVMKMMERFGAPFLVFSSSACVYGEADTLPVTEKTPFKAPESIYGETKQISEQMIAYAVTAGRPFYAVSLRYFNPIGAHDSALIGELPIGVPANLVPFITEAASGNLPCLTVFGNDYDTPDGTAIRDYIHVVDLARAHICGLEFLQGKGEGGGATGGNQHSSEKSPGVCRCTPFYDVFNLGTGRGNTVLEVIHAFEEVTGVKLNYQIGPRRPGDVEAIYASCDKAREVLGWQARLTLKDALKDAWKWQQRINSGELNQDNWRITMDTWRKIKR